MVYVNIGGKGKGKGDKKDKKYKKSRTPRGGAGEEASRFHECGVKIEVRFICVFYCATGGIHLSLVCARRRIHRIATDLRDHARSDL